MPAQTSYAEWLARQPYARQEQARWALLARRCCETAKSPCRRCSTMPGVPYPWTNCGVDASALRDRVCVMTIFTAWAMAVADEGCL
ncbi:hypothetical protein ACVXG7_09395 [Enterobacter hormaechei]